jgi:PAS domain S-box-containing protein
VFVPKPTDAATECAAQYAELIIPLRAGKEVLGVLQLRSVNEAALGPQQQQILRVFTERAAAALENLHLYQQIRRYADELEVRVQERTAEISRIKERVEAILNHSSDAIFLVRPDGRIQQVNDSFKQQFGFQYDDVYGIPVETLIDDTSAPQLRDILERVIASNQAERVELTARTQSGANFEADMMLSPLTAPPDNVIGVVCSIRDISERKQLEASLRAALEKEREVNEMQAQFIMRASHEFRTPLAVINSASDLLLLYESRMTDEQKHEKLEQVQNEVKTLTKMLDDMLIVSRGQTAREVTFDPKPFDLAALCQEIVTELESTIGAAHQFVCSYAGSAETLTADRKLIRRMLVNLLSNAVKFSAPGSKIYLSTTCEPTVTKISVTDEGIGIPPEDQKRLFQPFHRGGHVEGIEGTGLGLAIVKQSVEVHRGTVSFESVPGTGTTFVVTLPTVSSGDMEL